MAEIVWTFEASRSLDEIYEYIASKSPASAHKVVSGIYEKVQILKQHVRIGQRYERIDDREVREILYGHYRIAYLVANDQRIEVLGIFHSAMEIERYLR